MSIFKNRTYGFILFGLFLVLYIAIGIYGIVNAASLNALYETSYKTSILEGAYTIQAYSNSMNIESALKDVLIAQNEEDIRIAMDQVNSYGLSLQSDFSRLRTLTTSSTDDSLPRLKSTYTNYLMFESEKDSVYAILNQQKTEAFKMEVEIHLIRRIESISADLKQMVDIENEAVRDAYVRYKDVTTYTRVQLLVGIMLLIAFVLYGGFLLRRSAKKTREKIHIEQEELRITIDAIGEGVIVTDMEQKIIKINKTAETLINCQSHEIKGKLLEHVFQLVDEETGYKIIRPYEGIYNHKKDQVEEYDADLLTSGRDTLTISTSASLIKNLYGEAIGAVIIFRDITERRKKEAEINYITFHDQVTHVYNRAFFEIQKNILDEEQYLPISIIQGDINGLKLLNDAFGHAKGDELLQEAALILSQQCRSTDFIMRVGGDEFTIFMPNTDNQTASQIVKNIETVLHIQEENTPANSIYISIALGVATRNSMHETMASIIKKADESMYKKKLLEKKSLHSSVLKSIKSTLAEKSHETEAHASRLVELSGMIAEELELPIEKTYELELLATLHDIGKIGISDQILNKPGPLTPEEWIEMKKHPEIGYRIAFSTTELSSIARYILCHHERWDGNGYPQGLIGTKIPLLSRIISIVDSYDAMCDKRSYNQAMTPLEALDEIDNNSGTQFDPQIARIFTSKMRSKIERATKEENEWNQ